MKRSLGLLSIGSIAIAAMVALSIQAGCASDEEPSDGTGGTGATAGTGGSTTGGGAGQAGTGATGGTSTTGGTGGTGTGATGGTGGSTSECPVGQAATVADVADATTTGIQVDIKGAIASTKKMVVYFQKKSGDEWKGTCMWGVFVKDPNADRGLMVYSYGENAPTDSANYLSCPTGTDALPDIVPGDVLDIVGETGEYATSSSSCASPPAKMRQLEACSVTKTSSGEPPAPVVVSDLDALATGSKMYQGLLVKIENVTIEPYDGGASGPYGVIELEGTDLQLNNKFYYTETGAAEFDPTTTFNSVVGISHLDFCDWVLQPLDKCTSFDPSSKDCL